MRACVSEKIVNTLLGYALVTDGVIGDPLGITIDSESSSTRNGFLTWNSNGISPKGPTWLISSKSGDDARHGAVCGWGWGGVPAQV